MQAVGAFLKREFPKMAPPSYGGSRAITDDGLPELFNPSTGFSKPELIETFTVGSMVPTFAIWSYVENLYLVAARAGRAPETSRRD